MASQQSQRKTYIVTGGANGIGAFISYHLLTLGARVAVFDLDAEALKLFEDRLTNPELVPDECQVFLRKDDLLCLQCDVSDEQQVLDCVKGVIAVWGEELDGIVNNAGIPSSHGYVKVPKTSITDWTTPEFLRYQHVHILGTFLLCKHSVKYLEKRRGAIVNLSSVCGQFSDQFQEAYGASKGGVSALTHSLASSLGDQGIRVNCVSPGYIDVTAAQQKQVSRFPPAKDVPSSRPLPFHFQMLRNRVGRGEDVAKLVAFLLDNDQSGFITGQDINVDGGYEKKRPPEDCGS
ncbi:NAD(P)-binding protein [Atractiella rhizophila]|nr:NAD(P)-binding protein [Atractiella rhizophila]